MISVLKDNKLSDRLKGLGAFFIAAVLWLAEWSGDKIFGDQAFAWLRDFVSPLDESSVIYFLWSIGVPLALVLVGLHFFWRGYGQPDFKALRELEIKGRKLTIALNRFRRQPQADDFAEWLFGQEDRRRVVDLAARWANAVKDHPAAPTE